MRVLTKCVLCIAVVSLMWSQGGAAIHDLRCQNATNPRGVKVMHPHLTWIFDPKPQSRAYQVLVASSEEKLNANDPDLWDSGRVRSDQKTTQYQGKPLTSFQRCFWKVRMWSDYDTAGRYSETAKWLMGLLSFGESQTK